MVGSEAVGSVVVGTVVAGANVVRSATVGSAVVGAKVTDVDLRQHDAGHAISAMVMFTPNAMVSVQFATEQSTPKKLAVISSSCRSSHVVVVGSEVVGTEVVGNAVGAGVGPEVIGKDVGTGVGNDVVWVVGSDVVGKH